MIQTGQDGGYYAAQGIDSDSPRPQNDYCQGKGQQTLLAG